MIIIMILFLYLFKKSVILFRMDALNWYILI